MADEPGMDLNVTRFARAIWSHRALVAALVLLFTGLFLARALTQAKVYRAEAEVLITDADLSVATEQQVADSPPIVDKAIASLGPQGTTITDWAVSSAAGTSVLKFTATGPGADLVRRAADAYVESYLDYRSGGARSKLETQIQELTKTVDDLQTRLKGLNSQIATLEGSGLGPSSLVLAGARSDRDAVVARITTLQGDLDSLQLTQATTSGGVENLSPAVLPTAPISPKPKTAGILGLMLGLTIGALAALVLETVDDRLKSPDEVVAAAPDVPYLGAVPEVLTDQHMGLVVDDDRNSLAAEAFRAVRTSLLLAMSRGSLRTILVTSSTHGEGKSSVVSNLAASLAMTGRKVLAIDCDLRRPGLSFGLPQTPGVTSIISDGALPATAIRKVLVFQPAGSLSVLPAGNAVGSPAEFLGSDEWLNALKEISESFDLVIIDTPPMLAVTDAVVLGQRIDGVLLVARERRTRRRQLRQAVDIARRSDLHMIGLVVTGSDVASRSQPYYAVETKDSGGDRTSKFRRARP